MCGIAGIVDFSGKGNAQNCLLTMLSQLSHRGPDGVGRNGGKRVALGMTRLAIVDLKGGMQPLYNEDKSIEIIGNGEIYNYPELQKLLLQKGHRLRSKSDIETAAHLYEMKGLGFASKIRGMFALAIHDTISHKLILVRDRKGEKPIYYYQDSDKLVFASEMKALRRCPGIKTTVSQRQLANYFFLNYIPEPHTAFEEIKKLEGGTMLVINTQNGKTELSRYYDPSKVKSDLKGDPAGAIYSGLDRACRLAIRADVDVGISLSGGIDSAAILAFSSKYYHGKIHAFTVGYEGNPKTDERMLAGFLAKKFGVEHITAEIQPGDFVAYFPKLVFDSDDPIADIAGYSIYSVSKLAKAHNIKVLLGGLGGDELFWGYPWMSKAVEKNIQSHLKNFSFYEETGIYKNAQALTKNLFSKDFRKVVKSNSSEWFFSQKRPKSKLGMSRLALNLIRDVWLVSNCIDLGDKLSMASSVELRSPFLDYELMEIAFGYKQNVLGYNQPGKKYLKEALRKLLPEEVLNLPKKGFTPPVDIWLRSVLSKYIKLLPDGYLVNQNILSRLETKLIVSLWRTLPNMWMTLYQLLVLEIWMREYVWMESYESISKKVF